MDIKRAEEMLEILGYCGADGACDKTASKLLAEFVRRKSAYRPMELTESDVVLVSFIYDLAKGGGDNPPPPKGGAK